MSHCLPYLTQGQSLQQLGDFDEAIEVFISATNVHPEAACLHLGLANVYLQRRNLEMVFLLLCVCVCMCRCIIA